MRKERFSALGMAWDCLGWTRMAYQTWDPLLNALNVTEKNAFWDFKGFTRA